MDYSIVISGLKNASFSLKKNLIKRIQTDYFTTKKDMKNVSFRFIEKRITDMAHKGDNDKFFDPNFDFRALSSPFILRILQTTSWTR